MGLLQVTGKIDLKQFWPNGESDADTTKVIVETEKDAFKFQPSLDQPFTVTQVFEDAKVIGSATKQAIDKKGRISVRLQGIDAPELHYSPTPISRKKKVTDEQRDRFKELNEDYRQYLGETATVELHNFLSQSGNDSLPCLVTSVVSEPNEVFDTYARFVGDLVVQIDGNTDGPKAREFNARKITPNGRSGCSFSKGARRPESPSQTDFNLRRTASWSGSVHGLHRLPTALGI